MLGYNANAPSAARQNCTRFSAASNARLSFSSLKAEADGDLRVGARVTAARQLGFHLDRWADEAARR
jgi:hypothetical protein